MQDASNAYPVIQTPTSSSIKPSKTLKKGSKKLWFWGKWYFQSRHYAPWHDAGGVSVKSKSEVPGHEVSLTWTIHFLHRTLLRHSSMSLKRLSCHTPFARLAYRGSIRMASTIVGKSGRVYVQGEVPQRHRQDHKLSVFKAEYVPNSSLSTFLTFWPVGSRSGNESFVYKCVSRPFYYHSLRLAAEFAGSRRLRMHVDCNEEDCILVYPYFRSTLLALVQEDPDFPPAERKKILRRIGEGIQELHHKNWIHIGIVSTIQTLSTYLN